MINRPVPGHRINQQIPHMHLESLKIHSITWNSKHNLRTGTIRHRLRKIIPHQSRMTSSPWLCNLDLTKNPVPAELLCAAQRQPEPQLHIKQRHSLTANEIHAENRKRLEPPRNRYVLITQLSKPMISRHEQIIPTDTVTIPIRRTMSGNPISKLSPFILLL